jgi:hypothetical protein
MAFLQVYKYRNFNVLTATFDSAIVLTDNRVFQRAGVTQLVECDLAKVDVAGSNPVSRSKILPSSTTMMKRLVFLSSVAFFVAAFASAQDYKLEKITSAPPGLPAAYASLIDATGYRVVGASGPWCEVWFRKTIPQGAKPSDPSIVLPIAQGTLLGVLRFPGTGSDRRGQSIKAGLYTMRYSDFPVDGAHQGVAPQRDFALLTPIANDGKPDAMPDFASLVTQSKTSGTAHAAVFSLETPGGSELPAITKEGDHDWVLNLKAGDLPIAIIVVGKAEG